MASISRTDRVPSQAREPEPEPEQGVRFEIKRGIGVLSRTGAGWTKELNLVSWNGNPAKMEIRKWDPDHRKCGKGITLTEEEAKALHRILGQELEE